ncbi:MAG: hypothetical protein R3F43_01430 [bacterium]
MTEPGPHPGSLRVQKAAPKKGGRRRRGEPEVVVDAAFLGAIPSSPGWSRACCMAWRAGWSTWSWPGATCSTKDPSSPTTPRRSS